MKVVLPKPSNLPQYMVEKTGPSSIDLKNSGIVDVPNEHLGLLISRSSVFRKGVFLPLRILPPGKHFLEDVQGYQLILLTGTNNV